MSYTKTNWQNLPNQTTPINSTNLNNIENGIANIDGAIGVNVYSNSSTYSIGDYAIYNNQLYICTTAISTAENWNSNHWQLTSISEKIKKNIITATFTTNHTIASSDEEDINLNSVVNSEGDNLTLVDGKIKVGTGITKVKVSANVNFQTVTSGEKVLSISSNNGGNVQNISDISTRTTLTITPFVINTIENDVISLKVKGTSGDVVRRNAAFSNITIEAIV